MDEKHAETLAIGLPNGDTLLIAESAGMAYRRADARGHELPPTMKPEEVAKVVKQWRKRLKSVLESLEYRADNGYPM